MKKNLNIPELLAICLTVLTICIGAYININNKVSALEVKQQLNQNDIREIKETTTNIYNYLIKTNRQ